MQKLLEVRGRRNSSAWQNAESLIGKVTSVLGLVVWSDLKTVKTGN